MTSAKVVNAPWSTRLFIGLTMTLNCCILVALAMMACALIAEVTGADWVKIAIPTLASLVAGLLVGFWRIRRVSVLIGNGQLVVRNVWSTHAATINDIDNSRVGSHPLDWLPWRAFGTVPIIVLLRKSGDEIPVLASASDRERVIVNVWEALRAAGVAGLPTRHELNHMRGHR